MRLLIDAVVGLPAEISSFINTRYEGNRVITISPADLVRRGVAAISEHSLLWQSIVDGGDESSVIYIHDAHVILKDDWNRRAFVAACDTVRGDGGDAVITIVCSCSVDGYRDISHLSHLFHHVYQLHGADDDNDDEDELKSVVPAMWRHVSFIHDDDAGEITPMNSTDACGCYRCIARLVLAEIGRSSPSPSPCACRCGYTVQLPTSQCRYLLIKGSNFTDKLHVISQLQSHNVIPISCQRLLSKHVGESELAMSRLLTYASKLRDCLLILVDVDYLTNEYHQGLLSVLTSKLSEYKGSDLRLIGVTTKDIDSKLLTVFDRVLELQDQISLPTLRCMTSCPITPSMYMCYSWTADSARLFETQARYAMDVKIKLHCDTCRSICRDVDTTLIDAYEYGLHVVRCRDGYCKP